jgi:hypothetical protein
MPDSLATQGILLLLREFSSSEALTLPTDRCVEANGSTLCLAAWRHSLGLTNNPMRPVSAAVKTVTRVSGLVAVLPSTTV